MTDRPVPEFELELLIDQVQTLAPLASRLAVASRQQATDAARAREAVERIVEILHRLQPKRQS